MEKLCEPYVLKWHTLQHYIHLKCQWQCLQSKNMGLTKQETCWWQKTDLQHLHLQQQVETIERIFKLTADCVWLECYKQDKRWEKMQFGRVRYKFRKKLSCKMWGTLEIGVFVAIANDLILILRRKGFQTVINDNEADMDETSLEEEGKGNGRKAALFNLKETAIFSLGAKSWYFV